LLLTLQQKDMFTCDEIFTLYLGYVSKQVNAIYYKSVTKFVLMYRDCMNRKGWLKRKEQLVKAQVPEENDYVWQFVKVK